MTVYDQASRWTALNLGRDEFLAWVLPDVWQAYRVHQVLDSRQLPKPAEPDLICDLVVGWRVREGRGKPLATDIEFLTRKQTGYLEQMALYTMSIRQRVFFRDKPPRRRYCVQGVVVLLTGTMSGKFVQDFRHLGLGRWRCKFPVFCMSQQDARKTLDRIEARELALCVLPWIPLMIGGADEEVLTRWKSIGETEPDAQRRGSYRGIALLFANACERLKAWQNALKG